MKNVHVIAYYKQTAKIKNVGSVQKTQTKPGILLIQKVCINQTLTISKVALIIKF